MPRSNRHARTLLATTLLQSPDTNRTPSPILNSLPTSAQVVCNIPVAQSLRSFLHVAMKHSPAQTNSQSRREWNALQAELARAHAATAAARTNFSPSSRHRYLSHLKTSTSKAVYELFRDDRSHNQLVSKDGSDVLIWSHLQYARRSVVKEAIKNCFKPRSSNLEDADHSPLVILITEKAAFRHGNPSLSAVSRLKDGHAKTDQALFLEAWRDACSGEAEVLTIVADSANRALASLYAILEGIHEQSVSIPVLLAIHASRDSAITANMTSLRQVCDSYQARICVDGPSLALLAQPARPPDADQCLRVADVLLISPGSWFGFDKCASVSIHLRPQSLLKPERKSDGGMFVGSITSKYQRQDEQGESAVAPIVELWTVISQMTVRGIREKIDLVTHASETFLHYLRNCNSLTSVYEGVGCVIRISYTLPDDEISSSTIRKNELKSAINRSLYAYFQDKASELQTFLTTVDALCVLQFSPARLLDTGTFWIPEESEVKRLIALIQERASIYDLCYIGATVFMERISKCSEIEFLSGEDVTDELLLSYGAFRIVPQELAESWSESTEAKQTVTTLTRLLVAELSESFGSLVINNPSLQDLLADCRVESQEQCTKKGLHDNDSFNWEIRNRSANLLQRFLPWQNTATSSARPALEMLVSLPFAFYLHSDDSEFKVPFVSVEPSGNFPVGMANRHACAAAEIVAAALHEILGCWRNEFSPTSVNPTSYDITGACQEAFRKPEPGYDYESPLRTDLSTTQLAVDQVSTLAPNSSSQVIQSSENDGFVSASSFLRLSNLVTDQPSHEITSESGASSPHSICSADDGPWPLEPETRKDESNPSRFIVRGDQVARQENCLVDGGQDTTPEVDQTEREDQKRTTWLDWLRAENPCSEVGDSGGSHSECSEEEHDSIADEEGADYCDSEGFERDDEESGTSGSSCGEYTNEEEDSAEGTSDESDSSSTEDGTSDQDDVAPIDPRRNRNHELKREKVAKKNDTSRTERLMTWFRSRWVGTESIVNETAPKRKRTKREQTYRTDLPQNNSLSNESSVESSQESVENSSENGEDSISATGRKSKSRRGNARKYNANARPKQKSWWRNRLDSQSAVEDDLSRSSFSGRSDGQNLSADESNSRRSSENSYSEDEEHDDNSDESPSFDFHSSSSSLRIAVPGRDKRHASRASRPRDSEPAAREKPNEASWFSYYYPSFLTREQPDVKNRQKKRYRTK